MLEVCLSHDIDRVYKTFQYASHAGKALLKGDFHMLAKQVGSIAATRPYWQLDSLKRLEEDLEVKSTFYFLHETYPLKILQPSTWKYSVGYYSILDEPVAQFIRTIDSEGWEVGLHGSFRSYDDPELLQKEKELLERVLGHKIDGIRQHFLNLNERTWAIQQACGFKYDASFGHIRDVGFKENKFQWFVPPGMDDYFVVPLAIMDFNLMAKPNPIEVAKRIFEQAESNNGVVVLNWHQRLFNDDEFPGYRKLYVDLITEAKHRGAKIGPIREYLERNTNSK